MTTIKQILVVICLIVSGNLLAQATDDNLNIGSSMDYAECRKFIGQDFWLLPSKSGGYLFTDKINTYKYNSAHNTSNRKGDFSKYVVKTPFYGNPYYKLETVSEYPYYQPKTHFVLSEYQGEGDKKFTLIDVWNDKEKIKKMCDNVNAQLRATPEGWDKSKINAEASKKIKEIEAEREKLKEKRKKLYAGTMTYITQNEADGYSQQIGKLDDEISNLIQANCEEFIVKGGYIFYPASQYGNPKTHFVLVFKEKITGDTVYYIEKCEDSYNNRLNEMRRLDDNFVLMSHLEKQKAYYVNQQFVSEDGNKWLCKQIVVEKGNYGGIRYYFTNEQGNEIAVMEHELKNYKREDVVLAEQKAAQEAEIQRQKENLQKEKEWEEQQLQRRLEQQKAEAQRKANLINKYGQSNGELIFNGKVKIGFTPEMCREAWGSNYSVTKTTTTEGTYEMWDYGIFSKRALHFSNGKLIRINE